MRFTLVIAAIAVAALVFATPTRALGDDDDRRPSFQDAVGSWFGRAAAVPGRTICEVGSPGCPVPPEIVMVFTVNKDGTFIGIDSNIFAGGNHSTAHGEWTRRGSRSIRATFTLLQSAPTGQFIGGFKNLFFATMHGVDEMRGGIDAYLYEYTDPATGLAITDSDGFPTPSPLGAPAACAATAGCTHFGEFSFIVRRVKVQ
ncbi:MAG: hypothetical protein A3H97_01020 [Acidobacteria bacterium RIFCSPLOWO2_02_FULL_65_29]|nr:MAG: hypothetical protein A3H97_01020 [Acidobacteria bacterium RIFCSPLOWO2_02_FULL_65_29]